MARVDAVATVSQSTHKLLERPGRDRRLDLGTALLMAWLLGGAYLDAWAHIHLSDELETFFTAWHGVLYSGFTALMIFTLVILASNIRRGHHWKRAMPAGYDLSLLGIAIFAIGGVGDMLWHEIFGIEISVEGALSATHQLLDAGIVLIAAGPLRAAWQRRVTDDSWRAFLPTGLSILMTLSALTLISQIAHPFVIPWALAANAPSGERETFAFQVLGLAGAMIQTGFLMGLVLLAIRRWGERIPSGAFTLIFAINGIWMSFMGDEFRLIPAMVIAGVLADALRVWLKPSPARLLAVRAYAFIVPVLLYTFYFTTLVVSDDLWWRIHTVSGAIMAAGVTGLFLSVLAFPLEIPVAE